MWTVQDWWIIVISMVKWSARWHDWLLITGNPIDMVKDINYTCHVCVLVCTCVYLCVLPRKLSKNGENLQRAKVTKLSRWKGQSRFNLRDDILIRLIGILLRKLLTETTTFENSNENTRRVEEKRKVRVERQSLVNPGMIPWSAVSSGFSWCSSSSSSSSCCSAILEWIADLKTRILGLLSSLPSSASSFKTHFL